MYLEVNIVKIKLKVMKKVTLFDVIVLKINFCYTQQLAVGLSSAQQLA